MGEGRELACATSRHERGCEGDEEREVKDERQGRRKRIRIAVGNARMGEVSITTREECQRVMV